MTDAEKARIEARLEAFDKNADELWRFLHDPFLLAVHLAELLKQGHEVVADLALVFVLASVPSVLDYFF